LEDYVLLDSGMSRDALIVVEPRSKLKHGSVLRAYDGYVHIGKHTSIGEYSVLAGHGGLEVGDAVIIGGHCYLSAADHIYWGEGPIRFQGETARGIRVGEGAWLGARTVVLDGVKIGERCVVGAGSVVTKDLQADMICMGTPCREIRVRVREFM
jgi:acetyltransferase-like isoleucine patch superfamily enzyme